MQFASAMVSLDWRNLGYPSLRVAEFWDSRSCGIACLRMAFGALDVGGAIGPAALTEALLKRGAYSETSGWKHGRLAAYATELGLSASPQEIRCVDEFRAAHARGAVVVVPSAIVLKPRESPGISPYSCRSPKAAKLFFTSRPGTTRATVKKSGFRPASSGSISPGAPSSWQLRKLHDHSVLGSPSAPFLPVSRSSNGRWPVLSRRDE